ncbi:MAG: hypothetical protein JWQ96_1512 [Segetibacter sp.]|nr:hypothetical protein [Segetibacter sp.]
MKQFLLAAALLFAVTGFGQNGNVLSKEALNFERSLKEEQALEKYKQVLAVDANNINALVRSAELSGAIASRQADKKLKIEYVDLATGYANKALAIDANNADANYVRALAASKLSETETENKKVVAHLKDFKTYADKAIAINPNHARANYILGKWHSNMAQLAWAKKAAVKVLFGGVGDGTIEEAIRYMEKSRSFDKYFVQNHLELAKAYKYDNKPAKAIEILNLLVKLPNRTAADAAFKEEGKKMLQELL